MKYGFIKACACAPELKIGDVRYNAQKMIQEINRASKAGVEILAFPELSLCGYTCGDLLHSSTLTDACLSELLEIAAATQKIKMLVFVGLPFVFGGKLYNCAAAVANGRVLGLVPKTHLPDYGEFYESRFFAPAPANGCSVALKNGVKTYFSKNMLFCDERCPEYCVAAEICEDLWASESPSVRHAQAGAAVIVNLSASSETVGKREYRHTLAKAHSGKNLCAYVYADAGVCESTSDAVFSGNHLIYENGTLLCEAKPFSGMSAIAEIDVAYLLNERKRVNTFVSCPREEYVIGQCEFLSDALPERIFSRTPFVPECGVQERSELILCMQAHALARRLSHADAQTAVIGVSGGLDSALAFLVAVRAFDLLKIPRDRIIAVTMPGFGTTDRTKSNALSLMETMRATVKTVDIKSAVSIHFKDIGHDENKFDATYENAQARYRTMVLMDIANESGGIVIGTGDLSELALGWCTYNGDHMSMYSVNGSVPKTLVKSLVDFEGKRIGGAAKKILDAVLATEISPELLPPDCAGKIAQKTEDICGPYELHDFCLYHFLRRGASPAKIYHLAKLAFKGKYDGEIIKKWLAVFYRRFFSQQFKRNCMPDGVKIGSVSLSPRADWRMPSDAQARLWLEEVESL